MRLSKNFWLNELIKSSTADRLDISNSPTTEHLVNLTVVTHKILQPVREKFGVITVNSGSVSYTHLTLPTNREV